MPVHDWRRVRPGKFHHFHNAWIYRISDRLNGGLLPPGFYAAGEQVAGDVEPDELTLQQRSVDPRSSDWHTAASVMSLQEPPSRVSYAMEAEPDRYLRKQDHLTIRSSDDDRIVALIEITSRANKDSRHRMNQFLQKIASALDHGYHLMVIDVHAPGSFDPGGIHAAIWGYLFGGSPTPTDRPLTLVSYRAEPTPTAYVEPLQIGAPLPDMPLFLDADWYVNVPLEQTYMQAYEGLPLPGKQQLAGEPV